MISREVALALRAADVRWRPHAGDRFGLLNPEFADDIFTLAEMVVEAQGPADARVLGFNGTTEWALDSVDITEALWLPREDQLRELLGEFFVRLERVDAGFVVTMLVPGGGPERIPAEHAEDAYGLAVLARIAAANAAAGLTAAPAIETGDGAPHSADLRSLDPLPPENR